MNLQLKKSSPFIKLANKIYNCKNVKSNRFVNESEMQNATRAPKFFPSRRKIKFLTNVERRICSNGFYPPTEKKGSGAATFSRLRIHRRNLKYYGYYKISSLLLRSDFTG